MGKLNIEDIFSKLRFSSSIGFSRIVLSIFPWLFLIERWLQLFWILWSLNISKNSHKTYIESDLFQWNFNEAQFDPLPGKNVFIFIWFVILIGFLKVIQFGIPIFFRLGIDDYLAFSESKIQAKLWTNYTKFYFHNNLTNARKPKIN